MAAVTLNVLANTRPLRRELRRARQAWRQFRSDVNAAGGGIAGFQAGIGGLVRGAGGLATVGFAAAGAVAGIGFAAVRAANDFDMARKSIVRATGATGAALDDLVDKTNAVYRRVPAQFAEVAEVIGVLATAFSDELNPALEAASEAVIDLANFGGADIAATAEQVGKIANFWGVATQEVRAFGDQLVAAGQDGGIGLTDLLNATVRLQPQLQALGFSLEQTIDLIGQLDKQGIRIRTLGAAIDSFNTKAFRAGQDAGVAFRQLITDLRELSTTHEQHALATERSTGAYAPLLTAIANSNIEFRDQADLLNENEGRLRDVTDTTESWQQALQQLGNQIKALSGTALLGLAKSFGGIIADLQQLVHWSEVAGEAIIRVLTLGQVDLRDSDPGEEARLNALRRLFGSHISPDAGDIPDELVALLAADPERAARFARNLEAGNTDEAVRQIYGFAHADASAFYTPSVQQGRVNLAGAERLDDEISAVLGAIDSGELTTLEAWRRLGEIIDEADRNPVAAGVADLARTTRATVGERRTEEQYEAGLTDSQRAVDIARARRDAGLGSTDELRDALELRRDFIDPDRNPIEYANTIAALADLDRTTRGTRTAIDEFTGHLVGSSASTADEVRSLGSSAGAAATELTRAVTELQRFADGIIILNDGIQTFVPDEIIGQQQVGNSVITSLARHVTASTSTGESEAGIRFDAAAVGS